jgi:Ca-activated chloride channel family protein
VSSRHRTRRTVGRGRLRVPLALAVVVGLVLVTAVGIRFVAASASGCTGGIELRVAAAPDILPALSEIATAWLTTEPEVGGECVDLMVVAEDSPTMASSLTVLAGSAIDVAGAPQPTPGADALPAVWVPDSTAWLDRVRVVDRAAFEDRAESIATSPVVIAMPEEAARQLGAPGRRLPVTALAPMLTTGDSGLTLAVAEPRRESASLAAMMLVGKTLATSDEQLPGLVKMLRGLVKTSSTAELLVALGKSATAGPASEQAVLAHNASGPPVKLVAVQLDPVLAKLDYPFAIRSGVARNVAQAAAAFRSAILAGGAAKILAATGFRAPDGTVTTGFPESTESNRGEFVGSAIDDPQQVLRTLGLWSAANTPSRTLAILDLTSSMRTVLPAAGTTKAGVMVAAAKSGLGLFTPDSRVGIWAFGVGHQEVAPIGELNAQRRAEMEQRLNNLSAGGDNRAELYQTVLDAYKAMLDGYEKNRPNIIVVLTDGGDSAPGGLRLERFSQDLQKLADPTRPIRVVLIGIGVGGAGGGDLRAIAGVVGGAFFPLTNAQQIQTIFLTALLVR